MHFFCLSCCGMESVKDFVIRLLPSLSNEVFEQLMDCMINDCGVETVDDIQLLEENDLRPVLKPVQIRKLLQFKKSADLTGMPANDC